MTKTTKSKTNTSDEAKDVKETASKSSKSPQKTSLTMDDLLAATGYNLKGIKKGDIINGVIASVSPREILVDVGGKTEGVVIDRELETYRDALLNLKPGDKVEALVIVAENDRGQSVLSLRRNIFENNWESLAEAQKKGEPVDVIIKEQVRGGVLVDASGIRGYIPQSQFESSLAKQLDKISGRKIQAKVVEIDKESNRLVFSQKAISEEENLSKQKDIISAIEIGETVEAVITGVVPFGAFAKFEIEKDEKKHEVEGLIHISEIAWEKVEEPGQYLKTNDKVKVKIIGADKESGKLTLSLKQMLPDPWEDVTDMFEKDTTVKGTVTRATPYGIFVNLSPGIEGLIHISKISPGEEPKAGDEIDCIIEDVNADKRKISLSMTLTEKPIGYR